MSVSNSTCMVKKAEMVPCILSPRSLSLNKWRILLKMLNKCPLYDTDSSDSIVILQLYILVIVRNNSKKKKTNLFHPLKSYKLRLCDLGSAIEMKGVLALVSHLSAGESILLTVTPTTVGMIKVSRICVPCF